MTTPSTTTLSLPRSTSSRSSITFVPATPDSSGLRNGSNSQQKKNSSADSDTGGPVNSQLFPVKDPNLVEWEGPNDLENPQNWSVLYKWFIAFEVIIITLNVSFASAAAAETAKALTIQFHTTREISYLVTSCFQFGYVFGPFFWGPGSELVGRRPIFIVTMILYTLFILGQALGSNIQSILVTRFFSGFFAVSPVINSPGVIADVFPAHNRGFTTTLFAAAVFLGPTMAPVVSGLIVGSGVSWRWVYWVLLMFAGPCTIMSVFFLPETYAPILLLRKAKRLRKADPVGNANLYAKHERQDWSFYGVLKRTLFRPFKMLGLEPILLLVTMYMSIVYGLLFALLEALPIIFVVRRGFTTSQGSLIFIGVAIGTTLGCVVIAFLSRNDKELSRKWKGFPPPEYRLWSALIGAPTLVIAIFWMGWTGEYASIPWYVPGLSTIMVGFGISLIFTSFTNYIVETYLVHSASAFAANVIMRSIVAGVFPLFTTQMFTNLRVSWACVLLGLIAVLFAPCPFLFYKYGAKIRERSRFAPCMDLKIAKELEAEEKWKIARV